MEFRRLFEGDLESMENFMEEYGFKALDMQYSFEKYGFKNIKTEKRAGDFFGYFDSSHILKGAFVFTNKRLMSGYFIDIDILKRVDFLKTIKHYSPLFIIGAKECIDPIFDLLHRSLKNFTYDPCYLMDYKKKQQFQFDGVQLLQAKAYDFKHAIDILIESEVAFGRNPKIINNLKQQIWDEAKATELFFLIHEERIVSQGSIELETGSYAQIGGLYTAKIHRRRGYGQKMMEALVDLTHRRKKIPVLYVSKKNLQALTLYEKMGFEVMSDCLSLMTEL